jgi:hypothetical protein
VIFLGMATARRLMRRHQGLPEAPPPRRRLPLWRLMLGELRWALEQLWGEPRVGAGLAVGTLITLSLLGAAAPGPVLPWPGRVVVSLLVGLVIARGAWAMTSRDRSPSRGPEVAPDLAATEVVALAVVGILGVWLAAWVVTLVV